MAGLPYSSALILGVDDHVGAYLARLLDARGVLVSGVASGRAGLPDAIGGLGIGDAVTMLDPDAAIAAAGAGTPGVIFAIAGDGNAAIIDAAAAGVRLAHVVEIDQLRLDPAAMAAARRIADLRQTQQRLAFNAILHPHDSRFGPRDSLPARVTGAAFRAANGAAAPLELVETGPRDWGWTPEYVDAVLRLAALPVLRDAAVASGHALTTAEFAEHAFAHFGKSAADHVTILPGATAPDTTSATAAAALKAATGWSASTHGRDLIRALSEGAASRA